MNQLKSIFALVTIALLVPLLVAAQQNEEGTKEALAVEIAFSVKEKDKKPLIVSVAKADASRALLAIVQSPTNRQSRYFKVNPRMEGEAVRVEIWALLGNPNEITSVKQIEETPQESVASLLVRQGETVRVFEVTRFGVEPLEIKALAVKPENLSAPLSMRTQ